MKPHLVADIGNTRIKWGLVAPGFSRLRLSGPASQAPHPDPGTESPILRTAALPDDVASWENQLTEWRSEPSLSLGDGPLNWVLASVVPQRCDRLRDWLLARGDRVEVLVSARQLPLTVALDSPDKVGMDRLLDAVAARYALPPGQGAVLVDAGSAVTVDWLDEAHVFRGGSIFPGFRLMAEALHRYTALLPLVHVTAPVPVLPGTSTTSSMQVGIFLAVWGGIREAVHLLDAKSRTHPRIFLTGGDAPLLMQAVEQEQPQAWPVPWSDAVHWPNQTLEGILHSAEALP
jgi:type III pantothenate kinase